MNLPRPSRSFPSRSLLALALFATPAFADNPDANPIEPATASTSSDSPVSADSPVSPVQAAPAQSPVIAPIASTTDDAAKLKAENDQLNEKLDAAQAEATRLQADFSAQLADINKRLAIAQAALTNKDQEIATLHSQITATSNSAIMQDLATARQTAATSTDNLAAMREQLRQTQAQAAATATESLRLKTRLALANNGPAAPTRPGTAAEAVLLPPPPPPPTPPTPKPRTYTVRDGDSLFVIAKHFYGDASRWPEILAANHNTLRDADALTLGTELVIP